MQDGTQRRERLSERAHRVLLHPFCPTLITLLGLFAGVIGSVWTQEIGQTFPFQLSLRGWTWRALSFWVFALISATLFFFRERAVDRKSLEAQRCLLDRTKELEHLIRTLPPSNFLAVFSQLYRTAAEMEKLAFGIPKPSCDKATVEKCIRVVLRLVATLAQKFDGDHPDVRYAANIMIFRLASELTGPGLDELQERLQFSEEGVGVENLRGLLDLELSLSTIASDLNSNRDPNLTGFALPIPKTARTESGMKVLPGAPVAFVDKEVDIYIDTRNLREWCDKYGDFTEDVKRQLEAYFNKNEGIIRSFVSIPLFCSTDEDEKKTDPIAILK